MRTSTHYELNLVEGTDKVNPLVQDVPNYEAIDDAMYDNKCASIGVATELRTGTVHALTRQNEDAPVFRFTATSNYTSGDTFTVDGVQVSALLVDGTPLPNMSYIIGSEVLCVLKGTLMTVFANRTTSSDSDRLGGELPSYYATDSDLDTLEGVVDAHTEQIAQLVDAITYKDASNLFTSAYNFTALRLGKRVEVTIVVPANTQVTTAFTSILSVAGNTLIDRSKPNSLSFEYNNRNDVSRLNMGRVVASDVQISTEQSTTITLSGVVYVNATFYIE